MLFCRSTGQTNILLALDPEPHPGFVQQRVAWGGRDAPRAGEMEQRPDGGVAFGECFGQLGSRWTREGRLFAAVRTFLTSELVEARTRGFSRWLWVKREVLLFDLEDSVSWLLNSCS